MNAKEISKGIVWAILQLLGIAIILWLLLQLQTLIIYMISAGVVSLIGRPINQFFINRLRLKNGLATTFTLIILLGLLISIFSLFVPLLIQQGENLSLLDVEGLKVTTATLIQEISMYFQLDNSFWQQQLAQTCTWVHGCLCCPQYVGLQYSNHTDVIAGGLCCFG